MSRPMMERAAADASAGAGIDPLTILAALQVLIPLLKVCAGTNVAGWLDGGGPRVLPRPLARRWRQRMVRARILEEIDNPLVADRLLERLRTVKPLEMAVLYHEAGT